MAMESNSNAQALLDEIREHLDKCRRARREADLDFIEKKWKEADEGKYHIRDGSVCIARMISEYISRKDEEGMERWMAEDDRHDLARKSGAAVHYFSKGEDYLDIGNEEKAFHYFSLAEKEKPGIAYTKGHKYRNFYASRQPHVSWTPENDKQFRKQVRAWRKKEIYRLPIKEIESVPESERTPDLIILLASCYDDYAYYDCYLEKRKEKMAIKKALDLLKSVEHLEKDEKAWHEWMSNTYLLAENDEKCLEYTEKWLELEPGDKFILKRIKDMKKSIEKTRLKKEKEAQKAQQKAREGGDAKKPFGSFRFTRFWDDDGNALENWVGEPPTDSEIEETEKELGYKLPASYKWLMKKHNGGVPKKTYCLVDDLDAIADGYIKISGIYGIGREKAYSLCGKFGNEFMIKEWGYPEIGVVLCAGGSGGHDMVFLDYTECGKQGEPKVVHVDQESSYAITPLADNFVTFIKSLVDEGEIEDFD